MKRIYFIQVLILFFLVRSAGQVSPPALQKKIAGKKNLKTIMAEVEKYYKKEEEENERKHGKRDEEGNEEFESGLLHWKRWEYFNQTRLKPNGDLEDVAAKTIAAWEKVKTKYENANRPLSGSDPAWSFIGPVTMNYQGGLYRGLSRTDRIVFHPTDPNTFYVCANNGGLWRTTNNGASWNPVTFDFPIQSASGVAINPNNPANIFVLTGDAKWGNGVGQNSCGIWVTNDGGINWIKTNFISNTFNNNDAGYKLVMMPGNTSILFACTRSGLYRSADGGMNWTQILNGTVYDIEFDPSQPSRVYVTGSGGSTAGFFWLSTNSGVSFPLSQRTIITGATRMEIGVSPANSNYVYLLCGPYIGGVGSSNFGGIYRSVSKGSQNSFGLMANSPNILCDATNGIVSANDAGDQSGYDLAIDVHKTNAERIIVAGKIVWTSANGGTTLTNLTLYNEGGSVPPANYIHPDIQDIAYNPLNNNLYACTDGGVYVTTDGGTTWANITGDLHTATFYHMATAAFDANRIAGGTQDNGVKFKYNAGDFMHITGADGFDCSFGPSINSFLYATINASVQKFDLNGVPYPISTPANTSFFPVIAADIASDNTIYLAAGSPGVLKSTDGGASWSQILNQNIQRSICTCPNNSNRVYVTSLNAIFRTDNGGSSWSTDLALNPGFINSGQISDINVCSGNSSLVYVAMGGYTAGQKVFYSSNAGASWQNISGTLPAEVKVNCVAIDQFNNSYIGTDMGVYYQAASSTDWTPYYNGLPRVPVTDLSINQATGRITASTYGHGIWYTDLYTSCDADYLMSGQITGEKFFQASNRITGLGTITGGNATKVIARAGNEIELVSPNFVVEEGNTFRAYIGPCESSPVPTARSADTPPLFISKADKGDSTTLYIFGFVTVDKSKKGTTGISVHAVKSGDFLLLVTDKDETKQLMRAEKTMTAGSTEAVPVVAGLLPKQTYYVQLYYHGSLVHVQELITE